MKGIKIKPIVWIRLAVTVTVVAVSVGVGYRYPKVTKGIQNIFSAVSWHRPEPWILEKVTVFRECRHQTVEQSTFVSEKALKDFLSRYHPQWKTVQSGPAKLKARTEVHRLCPDCRQYQFLGIQSGKVVIMRGTPAQPGPVVQSISLDIRILPKAEREDLERGIPFKDEKEKLQLLEGLNGLIVN